MPLSTLLRFGAFLAVAALIWAVWFYQPERQLERTHHRLIKALESRNWKKIRDITTDDFHAGVYNKTDALDLGREILQPFFSIQFTEHEKKRIPQGFQSRITMEGKGAGHAEAVISGVNSQGEPFVFSWQRMSWKPWDWRLVRVDHPILSTPMDF